MYLSNITSLQVLSPVLIPNLSSSAIETLQAKDFPLGDCSNWGDIGMPSVMKGNWLFLRGFGEVYFDEGARGAEGELSEGEGK
jgi:hypothetical protein